MLDEAQREKEWNEWIALNRQLHERQIQSGIKPSQEAIPQNVTFQKNIPETPRQHYEMYCPVCGEHIEIEIAAVGKKIACPHCQLEIVPVFFTKIRPNKIRSRFANLTEETIRTKTSAGNTPVHSAAKNGKIDLIPSHLLSAELFMERNKDGNTPLHIAAIKGILNQVPRQFLTKETLTIPQAPYYAPNGFHITGSGYKAQSPTVLHTAAYNGHLDQIPKEFFTPEFLLIEATGYKQTVLEHLVKNKRLDLLPKNYAESELWNIKDSHGQTPREILRILIENEAQLEVWQAERETYVARVRNKPATEKQKEKLRWFGYTLDESITKGQASDAIDDCVKQFPQKNADYYNRPATEEQLANLRSRSKTLTYGQAKDLIQERDMEKRHRDRVSEIEKNSYQLVIMEFLRWRVDHYRHLTYSRTKKAARALDKINPGWSKLGNCQDLLLEKVTELFPELAAKENWS